MEQFGDFRININIEKNNIRYWLNDSLILNPEENSSLTEIIKSSKRKLLYRATRDGFTAKAFHLNCDGKENTITIIKNNLNYVFGGFASTAWNSSNNYIIDRNAFIFSLRRNGISHKDKFMIKNEQYEKALYGHSSHGPTFGGGHDILIVDNSNFINGNYCEIGTSFHLPEGLIRSLHHQQSFLAGSFKQWKVIEIEVYQVIN